MKRSKKKKIEGRYRSNHGNTERTRKRMEVITENCNELVKLSFIELHLEIEKRLLEKIKPAIKMLGEKNEQRD